MTTDRTYADFDVTVERSADGGYRARVVDSPAGEATTTFTMPFSDLEMENFLLKVGRPTRGTRRLESPEMEAVRAFGGRLYEALFHDDIELSLRRSMDEAERKGEGLRIRLRLGDAPELANVPWEYLFNSRGDRFLVLSAWTPIVRYVDLPQAIAPLTVSGPIRILALISSPRDYPRLDVEQEWGRCREALGPLIRSGSVEIDLVEDATLLELQRTLRQNEYHVFHYVGHGGFDAAAQDGVLVLEDDEERSRVVSGRDLGTILHDHRSLRLAVLNACEGARTSGEDPFSGVAQSLVRQGVPSVVAMQFEITDAAAIAFAQEFYSAISDGYPVDAAVGEARRAIFGLGNDIEWGTPVLYMRSQDGHLFDVSAAARTAVAPEAEHAVPVEPATSSEVDAEPEAEPAAPVEPAAPPPPPVPDPVERRIPAPTSAQGPAPMKRPSTKVLAGVGIGMVAAIALVVAFAGGGDSPPPGDNGSTTAATTSTVAPQTFAGDGSAAAAFTGVAKEIDGSPVDWSETLVHTTPHVIFTDRRIGDTVVRAGTDATAQVFLAWDADSLYVLARVVDDVHSQRNEGNQIWRGDAVDLNLAVLGPSGVAAAAPGPDEFQITLSPGDLAAGTAPGSVLFVGDGNRFSDNRVGIADVAATFVTGGYVLEAAIPWGAVGVSQPAAGARFGLLVAVFDNDGESSSGSSLQTVIVANTPGAGFQLPRTWGTLVLED